VEVEVVKDGLCIQHAVRVVAAEEEADLVALRVGRVGEGAQEEADLGGAEALGAGEEDAVELDRGDGLEGVVGGGDVAQVGDPLEQDLMFFGG
jgi:hypothetical protein